MTRSETWKAWVSLGVVVIIFVATAHFAHRYDAQIKNMVTGGSKGVIAMGVYVFIGILSTVIAPISSLPLLPAAAQAWGGFVAGILTAAGWIIGGVIAFWIARRYGQPVVDRLISRQALEKAGRYIPEDSANMFWLIVVIQILLPVDALSYATGLFTGVSLRTYALATSIGNLPSSFGFAYLGQLPFIWQILGTAAGLAIAGASLWWFRRHHRQHR